MSDVTLSELVTLYRGMNGHQRLLARALLRAVRNGALSWEDLNSPEWTDILYRATFADEDDTREEPTMSDDDREADFVISVALWKPKRLSKDASNEWESDAAGLELAVGNLCEKWLRKAKRGTRALVNGEDPRELAGEMAPDYWRWLSEDS